MKTLEEEIKEYKEKILKEGIKENYNKIANSYKEYESYGIEYVEELINKSFEDGVKFAQRWIPIDKELPKGGQSVFVKLKNGTHRIAYVNCYQQLLVSLRNNYESKDITHWRIIDFN